MTYFHIIIFFILLVAFVILIILATAQAMTRGIVSSLKEIVKDYNKKEKD
jgi:hypothetical protein